MTTLFCNGGVRYRFESGTHHARTDENVEIKLDETLLTKRDRKRLMRMLFEPGERRVTRKKKTRNGVQTI